MPNFKKQKLTDDEFVERIRKQLNSSRKFGVIIGAINVVALVVFCIFANKFINFFRDLSPRDSHSFNAGLVGGFGVGLFLAFTLFKFVRGVVDSVMMYVGVHYSRTSRLLITYYDLARRTDGNTGSV
jgi:hypothetical protein